MIQFLLLLLVVLWLLGFVHIQIFPVLHIILFNINGHSITLLNILILMVIAWVISILPGPFRAIASVFLILWVLSLLGIIAISGLSNMILIAIIIGVLGYILTGA